MTLNSKKKIVKKILKMTKCCESPENCDVAVKYRTRSWKLLPFKIETLRFSIKNIKASNTYNL